MEPPGFVVRDPQARRRAALGLDPAGPASLTLLDVAEEVRAEMSVQSDGCTKLTLFGGRGGWAGRMLRTFPDGSVILVLFDEAGQDRAWVKVEADGNARLQTLDEDGKAVFRAPQTR